MAFMRDLRFEIRNGKCHFPGIDWGYGDSEPVLVEMVGNYIVAKKPTCGCWESRGQSGTYPAQWYLFRFRWDGGSMRVDKELEEVQPGHKWHATKKRLIAKAHELARKEIGR